MGQKPHNWVGKILGYLTVLSMVEKEGFPTNSWYLCKCSSCKGEKELLRSSLYSKRSCGCRKYGKGLEENIIGKRFGRLVVIRKDGQDSFGHSSYCCKCDCGNETTIVRRSITSGKTKSCGCLREEYRKNLPLTNPTPRKKEAGLAAFHQAYISYRDNAKRRGRRFDESFMTKERFREITQNDCYYCGSMPKNIITTPSNNGNYVYNGIDRINSNEGYVEGNVRTCCFSCNSAKRDLSEEEFLSLVKRIYEKLNLDEGGKI